jgi:hypothetical protein
MFNWQLPIVKYKTREDRHLEVVYLPCFLVLIQGFLLGSGDCLFRTSLGSPTYYTVNIYKGLNFENC